jgi:hypothetical protein
VRHEIHPVLGARRFGRRSDDLEVLGATGIGADVEKPFALIDLVFALGFAGRDEARLATALRIDQADLGGLVVVGVDDDEAVAERLADADEEAGIGLLVDDGIICLVGAQHVQAHAEGPVVVIVLGVVDGA